MNWLTRTAAIIGKELKQLRRDRLTFGMVVGIPLLQLILFGYAINTDVRHLGAVVVDLSETHLSRQLVNSLRHTQVLEVEQVTRDIVALERGIRNGEYVVGIVIPSDFDQRVQSGDRNGAQILVDGSDPTILGVARQLVSMKLQFDTAKRQEPRQDLFEIRPLYNPARRSAINVVPGLLGTILTMTMVLFTAVAIVRERERGNLEFLINTPVSNVELMVGKIVPYIVIGLVQASLLLILGAWLFQVPMRGSLVHLYLATGLFIGANLSLGLLISTVAKTQFQAMQMTFFVFLPSILLSGFMFPFDGMPDFAQSLAEFLPLTHFIRLSRGVMLRDASIADMPNDLLALGVFFLLMMTLAILRFKKRLD